MVNEVRPKDVIQRNMNMNMNMNMNDDVKRDSRSAKIGQIGPKISFLRKKI